MFGARHVVREVALEFAFKLSIHGQLTTTTFGDLVGQAVRAEELGYDGVYVIDHLLLPSSRLAGYTNAPIDHPYFLDAWTSLAAIAQATSRVKVGPQVTPIGLRHPAFVAKWAATIDQISEGRMLLQVGAGHQKIEYDSYGLEFPKLATRIARLREGIQVIRALWDSEDPANYNGEHYVLRDVPFWPKPVQDRPPIWLGGSSPVVRDLVAELGDGWTPAAMQGSGISAPVFDEMFSDITGKVTDERHVTGAILVYVVLDDDPRKVDETLSILRRRADWAEFTLADFVGRAIAVAGSAGEIVEQIRAYERVGVEHITVAFLPLDDIQASLRTMTAIAEHVMPHFK
jgi:probable F420-dependent oxidoreductase